MKKANKIISIILFVLSGLLVVYTIIVFLNCHKYISEMINAGQIVVSGSEYDILNFYMTNCSQYLIGAVLIFAVGWLIWNSVNVSNAKSLKDPADFLNVFKDDENEDVPESLTDNIVVDNTKDE